MDTLLRDGGRVSTSQKFAHPVSTWKNPSSRLPQKIAHCSLYMQIMLLLILINVKYLFLALKKVQMFKITPLQAPTTHEKMPPNKIPITP